MKSTFANILFWLGDRVSKVMVRYDWAFLYPLYHRLMEWSDKLKPWPTDEEASKIVSDFTTKLAANQKDLDPEIKKVLNKRFWDLL